MIFHFLNLLRLAEVYELQTPAIEPKIMSIIWSDFDLNESGSDDDFEHEIERYLSSKIKDVYQNPL